MSQRVMKEMKGLQNTVEEGEALFAEYEDIRMLIEMAYDEEDDSIVGELRKEIRQVPEGQIPVTGQQCFTVCITGGQRKKDTRLRCWIILMETLPESRESHLR